MIACGKGRKKPAKKEVSKIKADDKKGREKKKDDDDEESKDNKFGLAHQLQ